MSFDQELLVAELAVQRAARATSKVHRTISDLGTTSKPDATPVSIADFAAQALIIAAIRHAFPGDAIVGEEDAGPLRHDPELARRVWELVAETRLDDQESEAILGGGSDAATKSMEEMFADIDVGGAGSGASAKGRTWILDPVDGTKGFIVGGQYCVCLALLVDGVQTVGVIGCPQIVYRADGWWTPADFSNEASPVDGGCIISAVKGGGARVRPLSTGSLIPGRTLPPREPVTDLSRLRFAKSKNSAVLRYTDWDAVRADLAAADVTSERYSSTAPAAATAASGECMDMFSSQMRYVSIAMGAFDVMIRAPLPSDAFQDNVWDHAGGSLICEETQVRSSDLWNRPLNFTGNRMLKRNYGYMAVVEGVHGHVLRAARKALEADKRFEALLNPVSGGE